MKEENSLTTVILGSKTLEHDFGGTNIYLKYNNGVCHFFFKKKHLYFICPEKYFLLSATQPNYPCSARMKIKISRKIVK